MVSSCSLCFFFFFNDTATTEIYTLTLHDALPISHRPGGGAPDATAAPNHQAAHRAAPRRGRLARVDAVAGDARCARRSEPPGPRRQPQSRGAAPAVALPDRAA